MAASSPGKLRKRIPDVGYSYDDGSLTIPRSSLGGDFSSLPAPNQHGQFSNTEKGPVTVVKNGKRININISECQ